MPIRESPCQQATYGTIMQLCRTLPYVRRARYLLDGAKYVVEKLGGSFPTTAAEMLKIPGTVHVTHIRYSTPHTPATAWQLPSLTLLHCAAPTHPERDATLSSLTPPPHISPTPACVHDLPTRPPSRAPAQTLYTPPGVGPYTAAAVSSIAFSHPAAVVDGNVVRVVSRLRALPGDPTKQGAAHSAMAGELLDRERPGCYNQVGWGRANRVR